MASLQAPRTVRVELGAWVVVVLGLVARPDVTACTEMAARARSRTMAVRIRIRERNEGIFGKATRLLLITADFGFHSRVWEYETLAVSRSASRPQDYPAESP